MPYYYDFLLNMWIMKRITQDQVNACVPKYISQDDANKILATSQVESTQT